MTPQLDAITALRAPGPGHDPSLPYLERLLLDLSALARRSLLPEEWTRLEQQAVIDADLDAIEHLAAFVRQGWGLIEPRYRLEWAPYFDILCAELEAVARGELHDLVVCLPPGVSKSLVVSVLFPAWLWLRKPSERVLTVSNADKLATRDSRRTREVIKSPWYRRLVARTGKLDIKGEALWTMTKDQDEKVNFVNTAGGAREAVGITSTNTGVRVDGLIVDDAHDAADAMGGAAEVGRRMADAVERYDTVLENRTDAVVGWRIVCGQRLADGDLPGTLIDRGKHAVMLPMEGDPERADRHPNDYRVRGELLHPRFGDVNASARAKGARFYAAQYDQRPIRSAGSIFKRGHIRWYSGNPRGLTLDGRVVSVDCAFKGNADSDRVAMLAWGWKGLDHFLLDAEVRRMTYTETRRALVSFVSRWPMLAAVLVEDKANGTAIVDDLHSVIAKLIPFNPGTASKEARAQLAAVDFESGHVYLPTDIEFAPWIGDFEGEITAFPSPSFGDDQVDATSQYLLWRATQVHVAVDARERIRRLGAMLPRQ